MQFASDLPGLVVFEDSHLLVANKPAGWNTHAPSPFAGEGIYEWLKHREPRWAELAIVHRLDKETSGLIVFTKTPAANRSLTRQFAEHSVRKRYIFLTAHPVSRDEFAVLSSIKRVGEKYISQPVSPGGERAETRFRALRRKSGRVEIEAEPVTGRTHQIRVHASASGLPILGDTLYGGKAFARVCLHARQLEFQHPETGEKLVFTVETDFDADPRFAFREAFVSEGETNAFRLVHGASDGWPGWYVDRLGEFLLSQSAEAPAPAQTDHLRWLCERLSLRGAYHKMLNRRLRPAAATETSPRLLFGGEAPDEFVVRENGMNFSLSFREGYSVGLFLDQRENRRRWLVNHVASGFPLFGNGPRGGEVLNTFAYTCGFSVCAATAGARVTSLDLSRKYLDWGKRNFALNGIEAAAHDFIFGDAFDWLKRLAKKQRLFDAVILDPPTFSQSKQHGAFQAERDFGQLATAALGVLKPGGIMFASTNAARFEPEKFVSVVLSAVQRIGYKAGQQHYVPQPPDFPVSREEPGHLKTLWLRVK